jgi:phosphatidylglycerol lysyltransferase
MTRRGIVDPLDRGAIQPQLESRWDAQFQPLLPTSIFDPTPRDVPVPPPPPITALGYARVSRRRIHEPRCAGKHVSTRWLRTEHQAYTYGRVYDSYFATEIGWKRFWSADRSGLVSYRRLGRYVKVIGGLLASRDDKPQLLREFLAFAQSHRLVVTFLNVTEDDAPLFREHGFQVTKWGEEPFVNLQDCNWSGKQFDWVRRQTNYCRRAGIKIVEHRRDEMDDSDWALLVEKLQVVSDEHLATKPHAAEIKLLEGQLEANRWGRRRLFVAYSSDFPKRIEAFLVTLPTRNGRQWAFEMYRHRRDAVRGVVPHLFHFAMMQMKAEGIEAVSLCLVPGLGCEEAAIGDSALTRHVLVFGMKYLNFLFDFTGIYHFKSRFRPSYESRYICARPRASLLSALALFRLSGMLTFNLKRVTSNLRQKHLKRRQRTHLLPLARVAGDELSPRANGRRIAVLSRVIAGRFRRPSPNGPG